MKNIRIMYSITEKCKKIPKELYKDEYSQKQNDVLYYTIREPNPTMPLYNLFGTFSGFVLDGR